MICVKGERYEGGLEKETIAHLNIIAAVCSHSSSKCLPIEILLRMVFARIWSL